MDYNQIVWLASYPKSGNTWVRMFLDSYLLEEVDINDVVCSVTDDRADRMQIGDGSHIAEAPVDIQQLARPMGLLRLVKEFNANNPITPLFVKTHSAHMLANGIELLPASLTKSVVYIVRDPRDVVVSFAKHMGSTIDEAIEYMDDRYRVLTSDPTRCADFLSSWDGHVNSFLNADTHNVRVFQYEEMRRNPVETFSRIVEHMGLPVDKNRVQQALERVELNKLREIEKDKGFVESSPHAKNNFFGHGRIGGWEKKLTPKQVHLIEKKFGRVMKRLGYLKQKVA